MIPLVSVQYPLVDVKIFFLLLVIFKSAIVKFLFQVRVVIVLVLKVVKVLFIS